MSAIVALQNLIQATCSWSELESNRICGDCIKGMLDTVAYNETGVCLVDQTGRLVLHQDVFRLEAVS